MELTKEIFLELKQKGLTFKEIGNLYNLTERQVNYRTAQKWGLDYSKKKSLNEDYFSGNTKAVYYWAGVLASDGWIEEIRDRVGLAFMKSDAEHLEKFKSAISSDHEICPFMKNTAMRIRFNSLKMVTDLKNKFNIVGAKTHTYQMPIILEDYLLLEFLRGYIDGDGHLEKPNSDNLRLGLCSANPKFLEDFKEICELFIGRTINRKILYTGSVYNISFNMKDSEELLHLLYKNSTSNTRLDRKYKTYSNTFKIMV